MECMELSDGDPGIHQISVKRSNYETINALNPDCWHLILNYLSIPELLQSEATCKEWQKLVLDHISHRQIYIYSFGVCEKNRLILRKSTPWPSFKRWLKKCGRSIIAFHPDCYYKDFVEMLRNYCPNLESLTLRCLKRKLSPTNTHHFKNLKILSIVNCDEMTDDCVNQFLTNNLEELHIRYNKRITGRFLKKYLNQLVDLEIKYCRAFKFSSLLSAPNSSPNMERLEFWKRNRSKIELRDKLHLVLDKMPNLSSVSFLVYDMQYRYDEARSLRETDLLFESLCRLEKLHRIEANFEVWDQHLEALASSCEELACVVFNCDRVTRGGLESLCRARGPWLRELRLSKTRITNDDLVALIYACPALGWLDISDCPLLDSAAQRVAAARRDMRATFSNPPPTLTEHPLTLVIRRWDFSGNTEELKIPADDAVTSITAARLLRALTSSCRASSNYPQLVFTNNLHTRVALSPTHNTHDIIYFIGRHLRTLMPGRRRSEIFGRRIYQHYSPVLILRAVQHTRIYRMQQRPQNEGIDCLLALLLANARRHL